MTAPDRDKLLVVEDDDGLCRQYRWAFPGRVVLTANSRAEAMTVLERERPAVAVIDLGLPPDPDGVTEGFATLHDLLAICPDMKVIVATGNGAKRNAIHAIGHGAHDFYEKPVDIDVLRLIVDRAFRLFDLEAENRALGAIAGSSPIKSVITAADSMLKICRDIEKLAQTDVPVLLLGDSGTGKEVLARALHDLSPRAGGPFIAINCGAIPEHLLESELFGHERGAFTGAVRQTLGRVELAQKGTLFLDEIGDLPMSLQVKLLRFLQEHVIERVGGRKSIPVDARIVSATNQNLEQRVETQQFRMDLFYRLNIVSVRIPPLRERPGDAVLLGRYFLARFARESGRRVIGLSEQAVAALAAHPWPGNIRELENRIRRGAIMAEGRFVEPADLELAPADAAVIDLRTARQRAEREAIQIAIAHSQGSIATAARRLGVSRPTLYALIESLGIADLVKAGYSNDQSEPITESEAQ
ncbi:MAG: PEP-CTERM-box response regulator transcription factor [Acidiphilium sp. 37-64-53]|uniref:PEP-CTERM-box response regulator transcription factor n=2 Tax=Acidocellaceae TaxID=3385905 RepID=UPI000BDD9816|nr:MULTISPECIES: PEP-CTERM-box response regulator transcription factor [Acidiphilium]OYW00928.1 MAG: PEP-CTERM-box response regulator transcription factor [Acidiphilium sp. 37-64-53]OZB27503.1 MAG: PEP-CTERM-box response regulator transcription factor [Acidiphilium sp. 34-64-41]HQT86287.1 PEP-CTERM-box response regulator transcription factor [Acidiphilium rubrum]